MTTTLTKHQQDQTITDTTLPTLILREITILTGTRLQLMILDTLTARHTIVGIINH